LTNKQVRQKAVRELVTTHAVSSQEDLRRLLIERGVDVTQATLSRDIHDLGLARISGEGGVRYVVPESLADDEDKPLLGNLLPQLPG